MTLNSSVEAYNSVKQGEDQSSGAYQKERDGMVNAYNSDRDFGLQKEKFDFQKDVTWGQFGGQLAGSLGGMVLEGFKMYYQAKVATAQTSAQIQITSMQENTKRIAIEADKAVQMRRGEVAQKVAEYQKDVDITKTKAAVKIKQIEEESKIVIEANKNRSLQIVAAQKMANEAWLRSSYQKPSPFMA